MSGIWPPEPHSGAWASNRPGLSPPNHFPPSPLPEAVSCFYRSWTRKLLLQYIESISPRKRSSTTLRLSLSVGVSIPLSMDHSSVSSLNFLGTS